MRGWVYIITNKAMPDLVKVGFSMKDPEIRAQGLDNTGAPHPYSVEYDALIDNPQQIEQRAHKVLSACNEGKEWFRCSLSDAIKAIKRVAEGQIIYERYKESNKEDPLNIGTAQVQSEDADNDNYDMKQLYKELKNELGLSRKEVGSAEKLRSWQDRAFKTNKPQ